MVCLPPAGYRSGSSVRYVGEYGDLWSSSAFGSDYVYTVDFDDSRVDHARCDYRCIGISVRLVTDVPASL